MSADPRVEAEGSLTRPEPLQQRLDALLPALRSRARDGDSPASVTRITRALEAPAGPGAAPKTLPVCDRFPQAAGRDPKAGDLAAILAALRALCPPMVWRTRTGDAAARANVPDAHGKAVLLGPGGSFFVPPNAVRAMRSGAAPLLALWSLWAGR